MRYAGKAFQYLINGIGIFTAILVIVELVNEIGVDAAAGSMLGAMVAIGMITFRVEDGE